jgi:hypothetical protein
MYNFNCFGGILLEGCVFDFEPDTEPDFVFEPETEPCFMFSRSVS